MTIDSNGDRLFNADEYHQVNRTTYESNDGKYVWTELTRKWLPKDNSTGLCGSVCSETNQTQMIHTIAVTTRAVANQLGQVTESEKLIVGPEPIMALDVNSAVLAFGIKHADKFDKYDPGLLLVHIRVGI